MSSAYEQIQSQLAAERAGLEAQPAPQPLELRGGGFRRNTDVHYNRDELRPYHNLPLFAEINNPAWTPIRPLLQRSGNDNLEYYGFHQDGRILRGFNGTDVGLHNFPAKSHKEAYLYGSYIDARTHNYGKLKPTYPKSMHAYRHPHANDVQHRRGRLTYIEPSVMIHTESGLNIRAEPNVFLSAG